MKKTKLMVILVIALMFQSVFALTFIDIQNSWAKANIERLANEGIVNGYPNGTFNPNGNVTIAESIKLMIAAMRYETGRFGAFWYSKYFDAARTENIITSELEVLLEAPNRAITRMEFVKVMNRLFEKEVDLSVMPVKMPTFKDIQTTIPLLRAYSLGVIEGYPDGTFRPEGKLTRAEMSAVFDRLFFGKYNQYGDLDTLPIFDTYVKQFDEINQQRYTQLKKGQVPQGTHLNQNLGKYEEIEGMDNFLSQYQKDQGEKALIDVRPQADYDYGHLKGSQHKKLGAVMQGEDVATVYLVVDEGRLTAGDKNVLKQAYKQVVVYQMDDTVLEKGSPYLGKLDGTFRQAGNPKIPAYLEKRFDAVAKAYDLTWTDEDFKTWWETSPKSEKDKYLFRDRIRNVPVFDFETKTAKLSDKTADHNRDGLTPIRPQDPLKYTLGIDDMAYISYELYKRNIEYMMKDGADWGRIDVSYIDDMATRGIMVEVLDPIENSGEYKSFQMMALGSDALADGEHFGYWLQDQDDKLLKTGAWQVYEDAVTNYVNQNTRLNMQLLHGIEVGQAVFDNYMAGYKFSVYKGFGTDPKESFDTVINNLHVSHFIGNGYQISYEK